MTYYPKRSGEWNAESLYFVKKKLQENMITILVMIMIRCKNSVLDRLSVVSTRPNPTDPIREWLHSTWVTCVLVSSCLIFTCLSSCLLGGMIRKNMFVSPPLMRTTINALIKSYVHRNIDLSRVHEWWSLAVERGCYFSRFFLAFCSSVFNALS